MFGVLVAVLHLDRVARQAGLACPRKISRILLSRIARTILRPTCSLRSVPSPWIWIHYSAPREVRYIPLDRRDQPRSEAGASPDKQRDAKWRGPSPRMTRTLIGRDMNARTQGASKDRIAPLRWSPLD